MKHYKFRYRHAEDVLIDVPHVLDEDHAKHRLMILLHCMTNMGLQISQDLEDWELEV